jgi:predicted  nucleic acid-binding Zn-ribbon protein
MCLDCGCGELNDGHADSRHITMDSIRSAAQASEISIDEAMRNISDGLKQAQESSGQTSSSSAASD